MKLLLPITASALALAACSPGKTPQRVSLDCPEHQGKLVRTDQAADGKACTYRADGGADIALRLVALSGTVDQTLGTIEQTLLPPPSPASAEAEAIQAQARADADGESHPDQGNSSGERVDIDMPGVKISASDDGADIRIGGISVVAGDDAAVVRKRDDVRLKGEALSREKRGVRATYFRAGDHMPDGWRYVGYEAAGPKTGPLAVAIVRSRSKGDSVAVGFDDDLRRLVRLNGGV